MDRDLLKRRLNNQSEFGLINVNSAMKIFEQEISALKKELREMSEIVVEMDTQSKGYTNICLDCGRFDEDHIESICGVVKAQKYLQESK